MGERKSKPSNPPAFARPAFAPEGVTYEDCEIHESQEGMSLRDYFAGRAIAGILSNSDLPDLFAKGFAPHKAAEVAYMVADAMLEERETRRSS